ncbi:hypothetical protein V1264_016735 [Littorina saxatilis]|uniref:P2X purinoreceptor 7 intracellular domain-containing protein n=1 Tax=Littorina saxatilis TaxID=31220 RepID=A0AAN9BH00_9CAEN
MAVNSVLTRIQFYWLVIASVHATAEKVNNCQITPSTDPEYANITCIFADNVGRLNKAFALYQDFGSTTKEKVTCNVFEGKPICEASDGFQTPKTVTERAVFLVPNTRNASFICDTVPPAEGVENRGCILDDGTPQATQTPIPNEGSGNTGWRGWHTGVVVVVLLIATGLIIAAVFWVRRKRSRGRANDKTDNKESAETENLNQSAQGAELELSAAITSEGASNEAGGSPAWCLCDRCRQMPKEYERICCRKKPCLSTTQDFETFVLDRVKAWDPEEHELLHGDVNETKRKQAYKLFTVWKHGHAAKGEKYPVYSCCVWAVRDTFPDENKKYTGFVEGKTIAFNMDDYKQRWGGSQGSQ